MKKNSHYISPYIIAKVDNHAAYNIEEDEYSTFSDDLHVSWKEMIVKDFKYETVDKMMVINHLLSKLNKAKNNLKTEKHPVKIKKYNRVVKDIETSLFLERGFIASKFHQNVQEFIRANVK